MKIERDNSRDLSEVVRDGIEALVRGQAAPKSDEERTLAHRDRRRRSFRGHWHAYISVMGGLGVLNLVTWLLLGVAFPWMIFPAAAWGIPMGIHALNYRAWTKDNAAAIHAAEVALGRLPPGQAPLQLSDGGADGPWQQIVAQCQSAADKAADAISALPHEVDDFEDTMVHLAEGMEKIEELALGAERIEQALQEIAPGGLPSLEKDIGDTEAAISAAADEGLRQVHHANRTLLVARREKVRALRADQERMMANAKGFLLATENLRLDTARIGTDELAQSPLTAPIKRLSEEVEVLRKVEAELSRL